MPPAPMLDFTSCTPDGVLTAVTLHRPDMSRVSWMVFGRPQITCVNKERNLWSVGAYLRDEHGSVVHDQEHDVAWAFKFEVIGLELDRSGGGVGWFSGWLRGDTWEGFRIPNKDYAPLQKAVPCTDCTRRHLIVERYVPASNRELFEQVRGCFVEIISAPTGETQES